MARCTLCKSLNSERFSSAKERIYFRCKNCSLVFLDPGQHPDPEREKHRYQHHQNKISDSGYSSFLGKAITASLPYLNVSSKILDYGCGPSPALQFLLREKGFDCKLFDPFFFPALPSETFDVVFSTETFEHFFDPEKEINEIHKLLNPSGYLVIMTAFYPDAEETFSKWHYIRDFTHVCFYNDAVMDYICLKWQMEIIFTDHKQVVVLQKR
jgi:SAM-dependent methyltransferase